MPAGLPIVWIRLVAVTFAATSLLLRADDPSASGSGDKTVTVTIGNKKMPVRVADANPYSHLSSDAPRPTDKYDPQRFSFNATSSMADKAFAVPNNPIAHSDPDFVNPGRNSFASKTYSDHALGAAGFDTKSSYGANSASDRTASEFTKGYAGVTATDSSLNKAAALPSPAATSDLEHEAVLGGTDQSDFLTANSMATKQYLGPGAQHVPDGITIKDNVVLSRMSGLPNRPLTVDEVRNLINHDTVPNLNEKPENPGKALNDPHYVPEPLRGDPSAGSSNSPGDDDKNDPVPPPGTMSAPTPPENAQPLPQSH